MTEEKIVDLGVFDALEPILKARPKTLDKWKKLQALGSLLEGKKASDITFTSCHPMYEGTPVQHTLGSSTGNLHFLLGYVNPGFHVAPYHWLLVNPFLTEEEAASLQHPANLEFWNRSGLGDFDEGDLKEGSPHPQYASTKQEAEALAKLEQEAVRAKVGYAEYIGFPSTGIVFDTETEHPYSWDFIKDCVAAAKAEEFLRAMDSVDEPMGKSIPSSAAVAFPIGVVEKAISGKFSPNVYPLVQTWFPEPGSIIPLAKSLYGVITADSVDFYSPSGERAEVVVFDRAYKSFDLRKDGDLHPSILFNFAVNYLNIDKSVLDDFLTNDLVIDDVDEKKSSSFVEKAASVIGRLISKKQ